MKVRYVSDLHLEFHREDVGALMMIFVPPLATDHESVLVLAGDISKDFGRLIDFLQLLAPRFKHVVFVAGNHEFYGYDYQDYLRALKRFSDEFPNITATSELEEVVVDDVRFLASTYWADGGKSPMEHMFVEQGLWDFRQIQFTENGKQRNFRVNDMKKIHCDQKRMLEEKLSTPFAGKTVVVTHHLPSYALCHPRFGTDCNGGFASESTDLMYGPEAPALWIFGHTHDTIDRQIADTRVVSNPSGYRHEYKSQFRQFGDKVLEL